MDGTAGDQREFTRSKQTRHAGITAADYSPSNGLRIPSPQSITEDLMSFRNEIGALLAWVLLLPPMSPAYAQGGPTGTLNGRVLDQSRSAIPGAAVTAVNTATNESRASITNGEGFYAVPALDRKSTCLNS